MPYTSRWIRSRTLFSLLVGTTFAITGCGGDDSPSDPGGGGEEVRIGPDGGVAEFLSGQVTLVVPAGALGSTVGLTAERGTNFPTVAGLIADAVVELGPDGTQFAQPVTLTISYDEGDVPATSAESELRLFKLISNTWQLVAGSTVNAGGNSASASIGSFSKYAVRGLPVLSIELTVPSNTVNVGSTVALGAQPKGDGNINLSRKSVTWSTSNSAVASVDNNGVVTGQGAGTVTITASAEGVDQSLAMTVNDPIVSVTVTPATPGINVGQTVQLTATARGFKGNTIPTQFAWSSSNNQVATVNTAGLVTGNNGGTAIITATVGGISGSSTVAVSVPLTTYAGTWLGTWNNTSFGTSGPASLVVTVNQQLGTMQFVLDLGGNVFNAGDPAPVIYNGTVTGLTFTVTGTSVLFGNCTLNGNGSAFTGGCNQASGPVVGAMTFTNGTVSPTQIFWIFNLFVPGGLVPFANGTFTLNKQ